MFINLSNHSSEMWTDEQKMEAMKYGKIKDMQFPNIPAEYDEKKIEKLADEYLEKIKGENAECVMCQGEFTFVYSLVNKLKKEGIKVVAACSKRNVEEMIVKNGITEKRVVFQFVKFREYI